MVSVALLLNASVLTFSYPIVCRSPNLGCAEARIHCVSSNSESVDLDRCDRAESGKDMTKKGNVFTHVS